MGNSAGLGGVFRAVGKASGRRIAGSGAPVTAAAIFAAPNAPVALRIEPFRNSRRDRLARFSITPPFCWNPDRAPALVVLPPATDCGQSLRYARSVRRGACL